MVKRNQSAKKEKAFLMRVERVPLVDVAKELRISPVTVGRWENGYIDAKGRRYSGWKDKLEEIWTCHEKQMYEKGIMAKQRRLEIYDRLTEKALAKLEEQFPLVTDAKTNADLKALMSEIRELTKQAAIEKGEYRTDGQTLVAVNNEITFKQLQDRYMELHDDGEEETD